MDSKSKERSNYFRVKDNDVFIAELKAKAPWVVIEFNDEHGGFCILNDGGDLNGFDKDGYEVEVYGIVANHLEDGEVAVFMYIGNEGMRCLFGGAIAINNKYEKRQVDLGDIYKLASELGSEVTKAFN